MEKEIKSLQEQIQKLEREQVNQDRKFEALLKFYALKCDGGYVDTLGFVIQEPTIRLECKECHK